MKISVIGCGWLGLPLGKRLVQEGHEVLGSTTQMEKFQAIHQAGISPVLMTLQPMPFGLEFNRLFETDCLIINIPPGKKTQTPAFYEEQVKYLKYLANQHKAPRILFVSSTSYYPNTMSEINEETPYDLKQGSSEAIVQAEKQIKQVDGQLTILRCGGIMGGDRIPGKWFAGKETPGPNTPINYIHRDDVIGIILQLLETQSSKLETLNLVCPHHPTRKEVYEAMAEKYDFQKPIWTMPDLNPHKVVTSKISEMLDYSFRFTSPLDF